MDALDINQFSSTFDEETQAWLREASQKIAGYRRFPLLMGKELSAGYEKLTRKEYKTWVTEVLVLEYTSANNYRKAWTAFKDDEELWPFINLSAMYLLAGPSEAHAIACDKARGMARLGELVDKSVAKDLLAETKAEIEPEPQRPEFVIREEPPTEIDRIDVPSIQTQTRGLRSVLRYPQHIIQSAINSGTPPKELLEELELVQEELHRAIQSIRLTLATTNAGDAKKDKINIEIDLIPTAK